MPPKGKGGRPNTFSKTGYVAIPPNSTDFSLQYVLRPPRIAISLRHSPSHRYYEPDTGMFAEGVDRLKSLDSAFGGVRSAGREALSDYQHGLMEMFDSRRQVLCAQHKAQTQASVEAERHLVAAQKAEKLADNLGAVLQTKDEFLMALVVRDSEEMRPQQRTPVVQTLFNETLRLDPDARETLLETAVATIKEGFHELMARSDQRRHKAAQKENTAEFHELQDKTKALWIDLDTIRDALVRDSGSKHRGVAGSTAADLDNIVLTSLPRDHVATRRHNVALDELEHGDTLFPDDEEECPFAPEEAVHYFSKSRKAWFKTKFLGVNDNG